MAGRAILGRSIALIAAAACGVMAAAARQPEQTRGGQRSQMAVNGSHLKLIVSVRGNAGSTLLPEQSAFFDVALRNEGAAPAQALSLNGNDDTPVFRVFLPGGRSMPDLTHRTLLQRFAKGLGEPVPRKPALIDLAPGQSQSTFVDLWSYTNPLPKGKYEFGVKHRIELAGNDWIESNRLPFEVVDARVLDAALGYDAIARDSSLVLWLAQGENAGEPRVLARISTIGRQRTAMRSGRALGTAAPDAKVAIAGKPPEPTPTNEGWFAIASRGSLELIRHFQTEPQWRSGAIELPATEPHFVPGFPDRGRYAVALLWGRDAHGRAALMGLNVSTGEGVRSRWTAPLASTPAMAACLFSMRGPIAVLFGSGSMTNARLSRLDVDENGKIESAEKTVRRSGNQLLAVAADQRPSQPQAFYALEANAQRPDRLTLVRIPLTGEPQAHDLGALAGWPAVNGAPARPAKLDFTVGWDGVPRLALLTAAGDCYGGPLDGSPLARLTEGAGPRLAIPLIASLRGDLSYSGFTSQGYLAYLGGR